MKTSLLMVLAFASTLALAHGTKPALMAKALNAALTTFEDESSGATLKRFIAAKGWYDTSEIRVKIRLENPKEEIGFKCDENHDTEEMECEKADIDE